MSSSSDDDDSHPGRGTSGGVSINPLLLHEAAAAGNVQGLRELLKGAESNEELKEALKLCYRTQDQLGCNALHVAILSGHVECVDALLGARLSVRGPNQPVDGMPPLCVAACLGLLPEKQKTAVHIIAALLRHEAAALDVDDQKRSALHWAAVAGLDAAVEPLVSSAVEEQERMLEAYRAAAAAQAAAAAEEGGGGGGDGGDADLPTSIEHYMHCKDADGNTAVALAARFGHARVLHALFTQPRGADVDALVVARNKEGHTPLHLAALYNHADVAHALLDRVPACLSLPDRRGRTAAQLAQLRGHSVLAGALEARARDAPLPDRAKAAYASMLEEVAEGEAHKAVSGVTAHAAAHTPVPCVILAPEACQNHRTAREPASAFSQPPPENVNRLRVLTTQGAGSLRTAEFAHLPWRTSDVRPCAMADVLRCHEWSYVRSLAARCAAIPDSPSDIGHLDPDTAISHGSFGAALAAAGAACQAVDEVMSGQARTAFCAVRPPGHHAGPMGVVVAPNEASSSHGFCLLSNVAIAAAYAMASYRHQGITRVAILDFDVHHGNGTEACVAGVVPTLRKIPLSTPLSEGSQVFPAYKPWVGDQDPHNIFFASVQGYGKHPYDDAGWFYPGSGATFDTGVVPPSPGAAPAPASPAAPAASTAALATAAAGTTAAPTPAAGATVVFPEDPDGEFAGTTRDTGHGAPGAPHPPLESDVLPGSGGPSVEVSRDGVHAGPRIINVGIPGPGSKRLMWRRAWRDKIVPAVANFKPDMIFVSAGFDAHKKEALNIRYVGITEAEYEWLTDEIKQLANRFCKGRIVSVLEGGYNLNGGFVSTFAKSVAAHVRALSDPHTQQWDPSEAQAERDAEHEREARKRAAAAEAEARRLEEIRAEAAAFAADNAAPTQAAATAQETKAAVVGTPAGAPPGGPTAMETDSHTGATAPQASTAAVDPMRIASESPSAGAGGGRSKRARRGEPVDYVALNAKIEAEKAAAKGASQGQGP